MKSGIVSMLLVGLLWLAAGSTVSADDGFRVLSGTAASDNGTATVKGKAAVLAIGETKAADYRVSAEIQLTAKAAKGASEAIIAVMPTDMKDVTKGGVLRVGIHRDAAGMVLKISTANTKKAGPTGDGTPDLVFWPAAAKAKGAKKAGALEEAGFTPRTWQNHWLQLRVDVQPRTVTVWLEGLLIKQIERPKDAAGPVLIQLATGDRLRAVRTSDAGDPRFLPIDITAPANDKFTQPLGKQRVEMNGVAFDLSRGPSDHVSLRQAEWAGWKADLPWSHETALPSMMHDPRMPILRVPSADYCAAHVLAVADDDPATAAAFTLRAGRYGVSGNHQDVQYDFYSPVPRKNEVKQIEPARVLQTPAGPLFHVRVPMETAFAQDIQKFIEIELTKEVRLARRSPDPNRYRYRPLGLPSGVRIAAITFELSPLQMRVGSKEVGHAFVEPQQPTFQVTLRNITPTVREYNLTLEATHLDGSVTQTHKNGKVEANATAELSFPLPTTKRGYHDLTVALAGADKRTLLRRQTSFALLPPDTRKHRDRSPFGTYNFGGAHFTSPDPDQMGPLYVKLGMRYGMFGASSEMRKKYGLVKGNEPNIGNGIATYEKILAQHPDVPPSVLLFHETTISGRHANRTADLFHDRPPYQLNEKEEKHVKELMDKAIKSAKAMREKYPNVHIRLGNGAMPTKEEFYRHKFPAELFDSAGNEAGTYSSLPEAQPPDWLAGNASLWMDRQLLDAYGYKDKAVTMCHEVCYPATNPGNLDPGTQADYFVRHAMHALAWGLPEFRPGIITDVGGNYRNGFWGSSGFCRARPEFNVKPAFVAFATMTLVLDGAQFVRVVPTPSASLYVMEFKRPDGEQVYSLWTIHGERTVKLTSPERERRETSWKLIDSQANEAAVKPTGDTIDVKVSSSPVYVVGKGTLTFVAAGQPEYADRPAGQMTLLSPLAKLDDWSVEAGRNAELEFYSFMIPRRRGDFAFEPIADPTPRAPGERGGGEGRPVLRVTPRPIKQGKETMPMYAVLAHKKGIPVAGTPTEVGVWVNGNSAWGRLMFEFTDASGQRWISLGAQEPKDINPWLDNGIPKDLLAKFPNPGINAWNTDDNWGHSRINFDGWRYLSMPLPGNYPGEHFHWPINSQWRWDKDGVMHYPLTFKKLIVELPAKTLHVKTFAPVGRPEIYLKDLLVGQGDTEMVQKRADEYPELRRSRR